VPRMTLNHLAFATPTTARPRNAASARTLNLRAMPNTSSLRVRSHRKQRALARHGRNARIPLASGFGAVRRGLPEGRMRLVPRFHRGPAAVSASSGRTETLVREQPPGPPPVVEEEYEEPPPSPPPRGRPPLLWPWLLLLLLLVAGGLIALWLFTRDNDHKGGAR